MPLMSMRSVLGTRSVYRIPLLVGGLLGLTGCFNKLDTNALEREIEAEIESQSRRLSLAEVRCPRDVYRQAGAYFRCVGQLRPEGQFTINVTQKDTLGAVEWDIPNSQVILNMAKVEKTLEADFTKKFSKRAFLDCGEVYRVNQPGEQFECQVIGKVAVDQANIAALLVKVDPEGNLNWYEVREAIAPVAATPDVEAAADGAGDGTTTPTQQATGSSSNEKGTASSPKPQPKASTDD